MAATRILTLHELNDFAQELGATILAKFNQKTENDIYTLSSGQCTGITNFWLCLHLFNPPMNLQALAAMESKNIDEIKKNYADILLMQKVYGDPASVPKKDLSDLGVVWFAQKGFEARFEQRLPLMLSIREKTQDLNLDDKAKALKNAVKNSTAVERYLSFQFNWTDDEMIKDEKYRDDIDNRHQHGHRIGIIRNICAGCEVLFFDSNRAIYAFPNEDKFYIWLEQYFKQKLRKNGHPIAYARSYVANVPGKEFEKIADIAEMQSTTASPKPPLIKSAAEHLGQIKEKLSGFMGMFKEPMTNQSVNTAVDKKPKNDSILPSNKKIDRKP